MRFLSNCTKNHVPSPKFPKISAAISAPLQLVSSPSKFTTHFSSDQPQSQVSVFFATFDSAIRIRSWLLPPCRFLSSVTLFTAILSLFASFTIFSGCWFLFFEKSNFLHNLYCPINDFGFDFGTIVQVPMFSCSKTCYDAWLNFVGSVVILIFGWWVGMKGGFCNCWDWDPKLAPWCTLRDVPLDAVCTGIGCCFDSSIDLRWCEIWGKDKLFKFYKLL